MHVEGFGHQVHVGRDPHFAAAFIAVVPQQGMAPEEFLAADSQPDLPLADGKSLRQGSHDGVDEDREILRQEDAERGDDRREQGTLACGAPVCATLPRVA